MTERSTNKSLSTFSPRCSSVSAVYHFACGMPRRLIRWSAGRKETYMDAVDSTNGNLGAELIDSIMVTRIKKIGEIFGLELVTQNRDTSAEPEGPVREPFRRRPIAPDVVA